MVLFMIYIRVDMNPAIATGHLMRCLSIADVARGIGEDTTFLTTGDNPARMIRDRGIFCGCCLWNL